MASAVQNQSEGVKAMYCVKCGAELLADAKFCTSCGIAAEVLTTKLDAQVVNRNPTGTPEKVTTNRTVTHSTSVNIWSTNYGNLQKAGIAIAAILLTVILALHNPTGGYEINEHYCDHAAIEANGGKYQPRRGLDGYLSPDEFAKSICHDVNGKNWNSWRDLSIFDYESRSAIFQPLRKVSGLLFGSALVCILLGVWVRLYGRK